MSIDPRTTFYRFASLIAILATITHSTFRARGFEWRLNGEARAQNELLRPGAATCNRLAGLRCAIGELDGPLTLELIGDSYSTQYMAGLDSLLQRLHVRAESSEMVGCSVLAGMATLPNSWDPARCKENRDSELSRVRQSATHVMISHNWLLYRNEVFSSDPSILIPSQGEPYSYVQNQLEETIETLQKPQRKFLIVGAQVIADQCRFDPMRILPGPFPHAQPAACSPKTLEQATAEGAQINAMLRKVQQKHPDQVELWLPVNTFCSETCPVMQGKMPLYFDTGHFNVLGSRYAVEQARDLVTNFLQH
jgi:hypothetical protein